MAPRSEEEKARRKAEFEQRKQARRLKREQEERIAKDDAEKNQQATKTNQRPMDGGDGFLVNLPEDALKVICCFLPSADLGRLTMTCRHLNQALPELRISYILARLKGARAPLLGVVGSCANLCGNEEEARMLLQKSFGGGDTGRIVSSKNNNSANEFVSYARFLEEAVHGYSPLGFRVDQNKAVVPPFVNGRFVSVSPEHSLCRAGGDGHRCGAGGSGCSSWGVGKRGQLGHGKRIDEELPRLLTGGLGYGIRIVQISAGGGLVRVAHSLLLTSMGKVLSFGTGQYGALGHGYDGAKRLPDEIRPRYIEGLLPHKCVCVAAGELHSAVVSGDGDVFTFGDGFCGQLGHGDKRPQVLPKQVEQGGLEDECVMSISCGSRHTLAVTEDGEVYSWGLGHWGALGRSFTPFVYDADTAVAAFGGEEAPLSVALGNTEGDPQAPPIAENEPAQNEGGRAQELLEHLELINNLSLDDSSDQCIPKVIESLKFVKCVGVSAGHRHSLVLDDHGGCYSFGANPKGCLGHGDYEHQLHPVRISHFVTEKVRIMRISAGCDMSMAVDTDGNVYGFGRHHLGSLGLGPTNANVCLPRRLQILDSDNSHVKGVDVDCGYVHSIVVALNGTIYQCGKVGINGKDDGQAENDQEEGRERGRPCQIPDFNIWHRVPEPKDTVKKERWKKYGKYEVKGRAKMMSED